MIPGMRLFIVRHGTTAWNRAHKLQGRTDIPLDEQGVQMARESGKTLLEEGLRFDLVYSSPLSRAFETARLLAPYADVVKDDRLVELLFGECEGQVTDIMLGSSDSPFRFFRKDPVRYNEDIVSAGGETLDELLLRTSDFMRDCVEPFAGSDKNILVSGHGALNRGLLMHVRGTSDLSEFWGMGLQTNCGITEVNVSVDDGVVKYGVPGECKTYYDESMKIDPVKPLLS